VAATPWLAARTVVGLGDVVAADPGATSTGIGDSAVTGPTRASVAGRTYLDLQNKARREKRPTQEFLDLYVLERFLVRLAGGEDRDTLILKGGALLAAFGTRRPTRDIDFLAVDIASDTAAVLAVMRRIAEIELDDGVVFDVARATAEIIRDDDEYSGVRVSMRCALAQARVTFHIDVSVGDPVSPTPEMVELPGLLEGSVQLRGYPIEAVLAEKIVTAGQRGTVNTRWRDFADVYLLRARQDVDGNALMTSLAQVAQHRSAELGPLQESLTGYADLAQTRWNAWVRRQRLGELIPTAFEDLLNEVYKFSDPALRGQVAGRVWNHLLLMWDSRAVSIGSPRGDVRR
jgi:hypothetical protein